VAGQWLNFGFQKCATWGGFLFSVFPPHILRSEKGMARRRKSNRALDLELFAPRLFGPTSKMKKSPRVGTPAIYQRQNFFSRVNAGFRPGGLRGLTTTTRRRQPQIDEEPS
jgi:hypothetical protein